MYNICICTNTSEDRHGALILEPNQSLLALYRQSFSTLSSQWDKLHHPTIMQAILHTNDHVIVTLRMKRVCHCHCTAG